ncbi:hypothetical protein CMEL01_07056 [Colletotrichum melonis]|uniref:Uncharacterized protein n=3 Tax=Colletotrichum acutatum species complex TaxID=2707335 RepID=A0A9P9X2I8_9PEZI|nr:hypothetical protein CABS02_13649 [Colletotrichum abscissum]KAK0371953.1 hypothetical protein CLIM01_10690 [Colletotrichum limetticola]KAK1449720.1 hypothetical protein CMEL01_07056 [Colletotrichum melonis]
MGCEWDVWMPGGCEGFTLNSGSLRWVQPSYHPAPVRPVSSSSHSLTHSCTHSYSKAGVGDSEESSC